MDGLRVLDVWDNVIEVLRTTKDNSQPNHTSTRKLEADQPNHTSSRELPAVQPNWGVCDSQTSTQHATRKTSCLSVKWSGSHTHQHTFFSRGISVVYIFEDNEAVIKMIIKGRSPTMRRVSRTHRVPIDWLFDRTNLEPKIQINYVDTKNQLAGILTKGSFARDEWNHLLCLFNIKIFSTYSGSHFKSFLSQSSRINRRYASQKEKGNHLPLGNLGSF